MVQYKQNSDLRLILDHLETNGDINEVTALAGLGIKRLSARIFDMRQDGYKIETKTKWVTKRNDKRVRVTDKYILVK